MYKMESYRLKCKKNAENIDPKVSASSNDIIKVCNVW